MTKDDLKNRIKELSGELDEMLKTPKRTQHFRHNIDVAVLQGRIRELKYLHSVWSDGITVPNLIEQ